MKFTFDSDLQKLQEENILLQRKQSLLLELDKHTPKKIIITPEKSKSEATAIIIFSDWHLEENVDEISVNGKNKYNLKIAEESSKNAFANSLKLINMFSKDIYIKNVVVGLLGDFISGYIHDDLIEENQLSPTQAILKTFEILKSGIEYWLKNSKYKYTFVCKFGNHGRTTKKNRIQTAYRNSYEWMLYHFLAKEFKSQNFIIENNYHTIVEIYNRKIRFHHGDWIKYQGGIGGITIPANKSISQWNKAENVYLDIFGHWHTFFDGGNFICNGSLIGYNSFAINIKAAYEEPKQALILLDKKRGKTIVAPIFVR